jgi:hypothetical protein
LKWKAIAFASSAVLIAVLLLGSFVAYRNRYLLLPRSAPSVLEQVEQLRQLATVKYHLQRVVGLTEQRQPFGAESILLMVQGEAIAGVDLTCLTDRDVRFPGSRDVELRLPQPKLLNVYLDEKETKVWDRRVTWWTPWVPYDPDMEHRARLSALADVRAAALKIGILEQAQKNAETAITDVLQTFGLRARFVWNK